MLADYCVDHLLMLVGGNALPNAVAGPLLINPGGKVVLLYSQDVEKVARKLKIFFESKGIGDIELSRIDTNDRASLADPFSLYKKTEKALDLAQENATIGLHYTGGTKAMAVHAYRTAEIWGLNKRTVVFSYLDARTLKLYLEKTPPDGQATYHREFVGNEQISMDQMMAMHGWEYSSDPETDVLLPRSSQKVAEAYTKDQRSKDAWNRWSHHLQGAPIRLPDSPHLSDVVDTLRSEFDLQPDAVQLERDDIRRVCSGSVGKFIEWAKGKWLESLAMQAMQNCKMSAGLHDICGSLKPRLQNPTINQEVTFELDVVAIHGYQLFAVSCTIDSSDTRSNSVVKEHLFEIVLRAQQLGGDEARLALVCASNDDTVIRLKDQVERDLNSAGRITVFGENELTNLSDHFEYWLNQQNRGQI